MRKLLQLDFKLFIKTIFLPIIYLLLLGFSVYSFTNTMLSTGDGPFNTFLLFNFVGPCSTLGAMGFIVFLCVSFEYIRKAASCGQKEVQQGIPSAERRTFLSKFIILLLLLLAYYLIAFIGSEVVTFQSIPVYMPYFINIFLATLLYILGPALIGLLIGCVSGLYFKTRIPFYTLALVLFVLILDFFTSTLTILSYQVAAALGSAAGIFFSKLTGLINSLPIISVITADAAYGQSIEPYRFSLVLFWVALCAALLFFLLRAKKRIGMKLVSGVLAAVSVFGLIGYWNQGSSWRTPQMTPLAASTDSDMYYYETLKQYEKSETKSPAFSVTAYELHFSLFTELSAQAVMTLDSGDLSEYDFTLHHAYRVTGVTDQDGTPLSFDRRQDYLTVQNPGTLQEIRVSYAGYHSYFYSSAQGAYLPGFLAYYPVEGFHPVMEADMIRYNTAWLPEQEKQFTVTVSAPCEAYTNLDEKSGNTFSGAARTLTVQAGMYREDRTGATKAVLPFCTDGTDIKADLTAKLAHVNEVTGLKLSLPDFKMVLYAPNLYLPQPGVSTPLFYDDYLLYFHDDNMIDSEGQIAAQLVEKLLPLDQNKASVRNAYLEMISSVISGSDDIREFFAVQFGEKAEGDYKVIDSLPDEQNAEREIQFYLYKALLGSDTKTFVAELDRYLRGSDTTDQLQFAKALADAYPIKEGTQQ